MSIGSPRKLWALIGAAGTLVIVALGYLVLISGEKSRKSDLENQISQVQTQTVSDQSKLAALRQDNKKLPAYKQQLVALRKALPLDPSTAAFVNDMQRMGNLSNVNITAINVAQAATQPVAPAPTDAGSGAGTSNSSTAPATTGSATTAAAGSTLAMTLSAQGSVPNLEHFLNLMQTVEPRALLITQSTETAAVKSIPTLSLSMSAFVGSA